MALFASSNRQATHQAAMQPLQTQMPNGINTNNSNMMNNNGMGFMVSPQFGAVTNGSNAGQRVQKTLELKGVCSSLRPNDFGGQANGAMASQAQLFNSLPREEAVLLTLIECFTFQYRNRLPHEMSVMPNATLYYTKLSRANSPLADRMEQVIGFRCCACRHTSQAPDQYMVGSTQLICMDYLDGISAKKMVGDLRTHIFNCPLVPKDVKESLVTSTSIKPSHSSMEDYMGVWHKSFLDFAKRSGYPKLRIEENSNNGHLSQQPNFQNGNTNFGSHKNNNNNNFTNGYRQKTNDNGILYHDSVMQDALKVAAFSTPLRFQQQQPPSQNLQAQNTSMTQQIPTVVPVETEDEAFQELHQCISTALSSNNFGLEIMWSRTLAKNLTDLPISKGAFVSPLMELLLQSYRLTLRPRPPRRSKKRSAEDMDLIDLTANDVEIEPSPNHKQSKGPKVYLECAYCDCDNWKYCLSTGDAKEAATFVTSAGLQHLAEECELVPYEEREKINKLKKSKATNRKNFELVENNFASWKAEFDTQAQNELSTARGGHHVRFWRPVNWRFIEQVGASAISDNHRIIERESVPLLPEDSSKKLPYAQRDNDVLIGWNGVHIGNRRFLDLLNEFRPACLQEGTSEVQQKIIAGTAVRLVASRGGRFYSISSNYATVPPVLMQPDKSASITLDILKYGAYVLLQPPPDCTRTGRGSRVSGCEYAPQRDVFGTEIIHNKRVKLPEPVKESPAT